jgi:hypothetical protein
MPISRLVICAPARSSASPRAMSLPAKPMNWPGAKARESWITGPSPASSNSVHSIMATASAPRGIMAPVAMAVAVPGATSIPGATPQASTSAFSRSRMGAASEAAAVSAARSAKPSTEARSKGGASARAGSVCATIRPRLAANGTSSAPRRPGGRAARKRRIASSAETMSRNCSWRAACRTRASKASGPWASGLGSVMGRAGTA